MGAYSKRLSKESQRENRVRGTPQRQSARSDQQSIREWLNHVRFKRTVFGGVRESDVWKKITELNTMYEQALAAERVRYDALLEERARVMAEQMYVQRVTGEVEMEKVGDVKYK